MTEVDYSVQIIDGSYLLWMAIVCFILAAGGMVLIVWLFKGDRRP